MSRKTRSLDRSSSISSENRIRQTNRSKSEPKKSNKNNLIVYNGICDLPDFYSTILGPTADETFLVGLETLLKLGFGYNTQIVTDEDITETSESRKNDDFKIEEEISEEKSLISKEELNENDSVTSSRQLTSVVYEEETPEDDDEIETNLQQTILSITSTTSRETRKKSSFRISVEDNNEVIQLTSQQKTSDESKFTKKKLPPPTVEEKPIKTRKKRISSTDDVIEKEDKQPTSIDNVSKKERLSFNFEIIEEEEERQSKKEPSLESIREIHKPEMIISISSEYADAEKETASFDEIKKEEEFNMEQIEDTSPAIEEEESRRGSNRSSRSGSSDKRVLISSLKAISHEDSARVEEEEEEEITRRKSSIESNKFKIVVESGNTASEIVVEDEIKPESTDIIESSRDRIDNYSEKELADHVMSKNVISTVSNEDGARKESAESSHRPSRTRSQATLNIEITKKSLDGSQNSSFGRQNVSKMSHELTSTIQEEESQEIEDSDEFENIEDKQSSLIKTSQLDHQTINESVDNKRSSLKSTEIPSIHSKLSKDKSSVKRPSNSSERSPRGSKQSYGSIRTSHFDQQSEVNRRPSLKSTEISLTHSKLSGDKISVKRPSNSSDRSPRGSKQSRGTIRTSPLDQQSEDNRRSSVKSTEISLTRSKLSGDKNTIRNSKKSFDRVSRGSKSFENSFDNVKVKISQGTIEEVTEESDGDVGVEPERSVRSATIEKSIKSLDSVEEIDDDVQEEPQRIRRKSKESSIRSRKTSKSSVSDTKVGRETPLELTEDTVESEYSLGSKKSDFSKSKQSRNGSLYKSTKSTGSSTKYTEYSSTPVLQLGKSSTHDKSSSASVLKSTSSSKTDSYTCTCNIQGDTEVCQCGDSNSKCACCVCPDKNFPDTFPQGPCPFLKPCIKTTVRKSSAVCSCCRSLPLEENIGDDNKNQKLCFDCYTSTSTTGTDSETSSKFLQNGVISKGKVRYAITKITEYGKFTTFEIMKSTRKVPKFMPTRLEGVFVLKHKI